MARRPVLISVADEQEREALARAFAARGWAPEVPDDGVLVAGDRRIACVLDLCRIDRTDALDVVKLVSAGGENLVTVRPAHGIPIASLLEAGATDIFEPDTDPELVAHRLTGRASAVSDEGDHSSAPSFHARLNERVNRAREREAQVPVFVVRVDGREGRLAEDVRAAVKSAAATLEETSEISITSSRVATMPMGEDGQAILIPELIRVQDAARFATAFRAALSGQLRTPIHLGVAVSPTDGADADALLALAHSASQRALRDGHGEVVFHSEAMGRWAFERLTLESSLRNALANGEFVAYYQPRVEIETREVRGMEALIRWVHPQFGLVSPAQFIPLAEETGLIAPIGEWMIGEAARQTKAWRDEGLPSVRVSVNLSPVQFRRPDLLGEVKAQIEAAGVSPDALELEVTESLLMNDPNKTAQTLRQFKDYGLHLSIDDFGTGYSSLSYLKRFPIDALKIDRSFVTDVTSNPDDAAIATAIILMGHSLKLKVVAEGVETENQLAFLKVLQCNEAQGYLFSPPVPADRAATLIANERFARPQAA